MGTWDVGNFDNDAALDYVGELMDELEGRISEYFESEESDLDEGEALVVPTVVIMQLLADNTGAAPPKADLIKKWQTSYLKIFDEQIDDLQPEEGYKSRRREMIARTFKGLESCSAKFWEKGSAGNGGDAGNGSSGGSTSSPQAVARAASTGGSSGAKRRFEFVEGSSSKFWEIELSGKSYTTTWGRIGTAGQSKTKECPSDARATAEYEKLVEEKVGKGYEEV